MLEREKDIESSKIEEIIEFPAYVQTIKAGGGGA